MSVSNLEKARAQPMATRVLGIAIAVGGSIYVALALVLDWDRVSSPDHLWPLGFCCSIALAGAAMLVIAWLWGRAIELAGGTRPVARQLLALYFTGEAGRYVPGGLWAVVGRAELLARQGTERSAAHRSVAFSLAALYMTAIVMIAVIASARVNLALGFVVIVAALAVTSALVAVDDTRKIVGLLIGYGIAWVGICMATVMVMRAYGFDHPWSNVALAALASWAFGFATPTRHSVGVREAVFVATSGLPGAEAAAVALTARLIFIGVDAIGAAIGVRLRPPGVVAMFPAGRS